MLQPELRCCDYAKATARHRRHRTSVPLFLVRRLHVDEHNVAHTCGFGSRQDATGSDLDLWMPQKNASSIPHSLDVAPVDLTTFDPAHSPVHHPVTPRAQLLKPAASSRAGGGPFPRRRAKSSADWLRAGQHPSLAMYNAVGGQLPTVSRSVTLVCD